ncbi:MAG: alpha-glucan phosphorylase [Chloroflexi bacterium GWB2_49_20]|nr:MAG: alpha-glucan phosphorylase [Chloroflexi bacterium GWB2_49_20]OGN79175.1 MAG: alpha-glucan phosphorylase [Chloroflexi bacterium GWC2_49_37]OGN83567.1 MAG: alpha-glucan phosphorylase [Chloroflexi bacterium GWD2_49_16]HCC78714.1 alpha-glucan phosphorylase [Anaerolineae bacterium]
MPTFRTKIPNRFDLPRRITRLGELAYNLWWTWNPDAQRLFSRIDQELWERLNHNPLLFLRQVGRSEINAASQNKHYLGQYDQVLADFDVYLGNTEPWFARMHPQDSPKTIAYFSMEFGLHETLPIYSGGLGVLSGDHLKGASDLGLNLVGIGFMYAEGYFSQRISEDGWQETQNNPITVSNLPIVPVLKEDGQPLSIAVKFPDRTVSARIWELRVGRVPLYLLDSDYSANNPDDRKLTTRLYWSDLDLRVMQEILLGVGGVQALRALGYDPQVWHMNEGHAAFLTLERARELVAEGLSFEEACARTRTSNVFTTHTPVPAGNDEFPLWLVDKYLANLWPELGLTREQFVDLARHKQNFGETFSMPTLALKFSDHRNAVSELHGRVARRMWNYLWPELSEEDVPISYITNGVHSTTWMARRQRMLYDRHLEQDWLEHLDDPETWSHVSELPDAELWEIHQHLKRKLAFYLLGRARQRWMKGGFHPVQVIASGALLDPYVLTIGFARRFATYKRADLIFSDLPRLFDLLNRPNRPVQILFAGKAHPADEPGKLLIQEVYRTIKKAENGGRLVFLEDYDINLARYLVQGVDVWLNTPSRPNEASGTSGMKAAINGVLNFSILDGWWREAYNGNNGWAIGEDSDLSTEVQDKADSASLYHILENEIVPLYYAERGADNIPHEWVTRMKESIRTVTPQFSMSRMLKEYAERLYFPK